MIDDRNFGGKDKKTSLIEDASPYAHGKADHAIDTAHDTLGAAMESAAAWRDTVVAFTKNKPVAALAAAISVGFVLRSLTQTGRR